MEGLADKLPVVPISLGGHQYVLPVEKIIEFIQMVEITPIPRSAPYISGVIGLRGTLIPIVEASHFLMSQNSETIDLHTRLVICQMLGGRIGFACRHPQPVIQVALPGEHTTQTQPMVKVDEALVPLLDLDKLAAEQEVEEIEKIRDMGSTQVLGSN